MAKIVHTILFGEEINSSRQVYIDNCVCQLFLIRHDDSATVTQIAEDIDKPAVYILLNRETKKAYIGQTDSFKKRLQQHWNKSFWTEAMCFQANDNSLHLTSIHYLEAIAYDLAKKVDNYDLSENTQVPKKPVTTPQHRIPAEQFFEYVQFLTQFVGCDIFNANKKHVKIEHIPVSKSHKDKGPDKSLTESISGRVKFALNGQGKYNKGQFVWQLIKTYIDNNPTISFNELKEVFPQSLIYPWSGWPLLQSDLEYAQSSKYAGRYVRGEGRILFTADGTQFMVCNQWDSNNFWKVLDLTKQLGMSYKILN